MPTTTPLHLSGESNSRRYRFGPFEVDSRAGELRKHGSRLRLRPQPVQILLMLLERPGEVVLRDEICRQLWPDNTVVEFDHSINVAVQKLRDVLGDSAESPRFIETLPRRGYRFISTVEVLGEVQRKLEPVVMPVAPVPQREPEAPTRWGMSARFVSTAMVCLLAMAVWMYYRTGNQAPRNFTLPLGPVGLAVVSKDGSSVAFKREEGIVIRHLDSLTEVPVTTKLPLIDEPAWSPDGTQLAFQTPDGLYRVPAGKGTAVRVCGALGPTRGLHWGDDGNILFAAYGAGARSGIYTVPSAGGTPVRLEFPELKGGDYYQPEFIPGGTDILFAWVGFGDAQAGVYLASVEKGRVVSPARLLRKNGTAAHFAPAGSGTLLYVQDDALYAQRLNARARSVEGEPRQIVDGVFSRESLRKAQFSISMNGVLAWRKGKTEQQQLTWFDRRGEVLGTAGPRAEISDVRLSNDGRHILVTSQGVRRVGVVEAHQSGYLELPGVAQAIWHPDNLHILLRDFAAPERVLLRAAEGGAERELARPPGITNFKDISQDGKVLLYGVRRALAGVRLDGAPQSRAQEVVPADQAVFAARFSPDAKWIVYCARTGEVTQIFLARFPSHELRRQISVEGGREPLWRGDGREILYRNGRQVYSVRVEMTRGEAKTLPPEKLFTVRVPDSLIGMSEAMAVSRDGSAILFAQAAETDPKITFVMTAWGSLLK